MPPTLRRVLIANRGEIAIRIAAAADAVGIESVAVSPPADERSLHTRVTTMRRPIGTDTRDPIAAYLDGEALIAAAVDAGCDCIHPGYGFLAEQAAFAERCAAAGLTFVGPSPKTLALFGDKVAARALARSLGIPIVGGSDGAVDSAAEAGGVAAEVGYPVILKAAAGGGGRGMRVVDRAADMAEAFDRCRSEATAAFGRGELFVERLIDRPRHVEVQVLADRHGNLVHLHDRDCSVQLRHQKVIEIAPAPALPADLRQRMFDHALDLAQASGYVNAGTVEFLVSPERDDSAFIECNARIQVEHTVTEQVTGVDLVAAQFRIAGGATLAELGIGGQHDVTTRGFRRAGTGRRHRTGDADGLQRALRPGRARRCRRVRGLRPTAAVRSTAGQGHRLGARRRRCRRPHPPRRRSVPCRGAADEPVPAARHPRPSRGARRRRPHDAARRGPRAGRPAGAARCPRRGLVNDGRRGVARRDHGSAGARCRAGPAGGAHADGRHRRRGPRRDR